MVDSSPPTRSPYRADRQIVISQVNAFFSENLATTNAVIIDLIFVATVRELDAVIQKANDDDPNWNIGRFIIVNILQRLQLENPMLYDRLCSKLSGMIYSSDDINITTPVRFVELMGTTGAIALSRMNILDLIKETWGNDKPISANEFIIWEHHQYGMVGPKRFPLG